VTFLSCQYKGENSFRAVVTASLDHLTSAGREGIPIPIKVHITPPALHETTFVLHRL
jgi:hypothetical protein